MTTANTNFNLLSFIFADLARHPVRVLLFLAVLLSAGAVILSAHHNRQMAIALEKLMQQQDQLDVEWRHLVLEQSALTEHNRIETLVEKKLNMHRPQPGEEVVVRIK
ncbi:cell division protein FtsL [Paraglaciecola hydrolytica]|uniref:Cell division protein FtsL n=1 Tax=Paraglaciecola hydrolytica TaxID=1799789 RepID=A0A136A6P4_9ALTE|nr:cell division protein FtsL [Paraglaciecola hydrolytica]KXI30903.1 cell division protein FtsL [Paraglaciecola hydrolytica]